MFNLYIRHSHMDADIPQSRRDEALSDECYDQWVSQYKMREKVHCPPDLRDELNEPTVECRFEIGGGSITDTGIHRRHDICLMLMWALCN